MKKSFYILVVVFLFSCTKTENIISGKWKFISITNDEGENVKPISSADYMEIKTDKTFNYILFDAEIEAEGTWKLDENSLEYTYNSEDSSTEKVIRTYELKIVDQDKLILFEKGIKYAFERSVN